MKANNCFIKLVKLQMVLNKKYAEKLHVAEIYMLATSLARQTKLTMKMYMFIVLRESYFQQPSYLEDGCCLY